MIVLKRLQRLALSRSDAFFYAFSSAKEKLSDAGEQAVWAHRIIKLIKDDDSFPLGIEKPNILDKITSLGVLNDQKFVYKQKNDSYPNRDEVVKMMTDGIVLNPIVFEQEKVTLAKQIDFEKAPGTLAEQFKNQQSNRPFIFHPSYLGARNIFNLLERPVLKNVFITGGAGISKTISIIFYIHLSNFITKYAAQCSKNPYLQKQLELLQKENLLNHTFIKYWYWSADYNRNAHRLEELMVEQAVELEQNDKEELLSISKWLDFKTKLCQFYPNSIKMYPIVDQFNLIASLMRRGNYLRQISRLNAQRFQKLPSQELYELNFDDVFQKADNLTLDFYKFIKLGNYYRLNSSLSIEKELISKKINSFIMRDKSYKMGLQLNQLVFYRVPYQIQLLVQKGNADFWNITWFEIWRRLKLEKTPPKTVEEIKKKYLQVVKTRAPTNFFRFLHLRGFLGNCQYYFSKVNSDSSIFIQNIKKMIDEYSIYCMDKEKNSFEEMFAKCQHWRKELFFVLHEFAEIAVQDQKQKDRLAEFDLSIIDSIQPFRKYKIIEKMKNIIAHKAGEPFPFHLEDGKILKLNWTFLQFYELTTYALYPPVAKLIFTSNSQLLSKILKKKGSLKGGLLQCAIMLALTPKSTLTYSVRSKDDASVVYKKGLKIAGKVNFIPINPELTINKNVDKKEHFRKNFGNILSICENNPNLDYFAEPQYEEHGITRSSQTSEGIDFIIAKYQADKKKYLIRTYDITVLEYQSLKIKEFKEQVFPQLKRLANEGGFTPENIQFEHVILSLKKSIETSKEKSQSNSFQPTIIQSDVNQLAVQNQSNQDAISFIAIAQLHNETCLALRKKYQKRARAAKAADTN